MNRFSIIITAIFTGFLVGQGIFWGVLTEGPSLYAQGLQAENRGLEQKAIPLYIQALASTDIPVDEQRASAEALIDLYTQANALDEAATYHQWMIDHGFEPLQHLRALMQGQFMQGHHMRMAQVAFALAQHPAAEFEDLEMAIEHLIWIGRFDEAQTLIDGRLAEKSPLGAHLLKAQSLVSQGDWKSARTFLNRQLEAYSGAAGLFALSCHLYLTQRHLKKAAGDCERAVKIDTHHGRALAVQSQVALVNGDLEAALSLIERAQSFSPDDVEVLGQAAQIFERAGDYERSDAALQALEGQAVLDYWQGRRRLTSGDFHGARGFFKRLIQRMPGVSHGYAGLALAWLALGDIAEAGGVLARLPEALRAHPELRILRGEVLLKQGEAQNAADIAEEVLADFPTYSPALGLMAGVEMVGGAPGHGIILLKKALKYDPSSLIIRHRMADAYLAMNLGQLAKRTYLEILDMAPAEVQAHLRLAAIYTLENAPEVAIQHIEKALKAGASAEEIAGDPRFEALVEYQSFHRLLH